MQADLALVLTLTNVKFYSSHNSGRVLWYTIWVFFCLSIYTALHFYFSWNFA